MLIRSKKSGIIYENICLEKNGKCGCPIDTEDLTEIDFADYDFGYTRLCDTCGEIANKELLCEGVHCFNVNCKGSNDDFIGEITFTTEEIRNDLEVYNEY